MALTCVSDAPCPLSRPVYLSIHPSIYTCQFLCVSLSFFLSLSFSLTLSLARARGHALSLYTYAHKCIQTVTVHLQAEDRAHRIGQQYSVNVHFLLAKDTIDDIIWNSIEKKLNVVGNALDGKGVWGCVGVWGG